jgi:predicted phage-related endonuclease
MKILNLVQGSPEWIADRLKHFTASEAPAMMGDSKFMSRTELLVLKKTGNSKSVDKFAQSLFDNGHAAEESARPFAEIELKNHHFEKVKLLPIVASINIDGLNLLASYDGYCESPLSIWEHKLFNKNLIENVLNGVLEPHHYWQLEHQALVADADEVMFTCSDGTEENAASMMYMSVPERREKLIAGWKQFAIDLDDYEVKAKAEVIVAQKIKELPSLEISLIGEVSNSNLAAYKSTALTFISSIKTELQTEQDFKDAAEAIKFLKNGEDELESVKIRSLNQTIDIKEMFETIDELKEGMRQKRLTLTKLAKTEKDRIRIDLNQAATANFQLFITDVSKSIMPIQLLSLASFDTDFNSAMKGKSTIDSLQNCVDTKLSQLKIEVNEVVSLITTNLNSLKELASDHKFLFSDTPHLVLKDNEDLVNLIKMRISEHETAEEAKAEQLRKDIQAEEERKAKIVRILMPSGIREFADITIATQAAQAANGYLDHADDGSIEFKLNKPVEVEQKVVRRSIPVKQEIQTSVDKEVVPLQEKAPIKQRLAERFENIPENGKAEMIRQLNFWKDEYGVRSNEFADLMCIINQHAYCEDQSKQAA